MGGGIELDVTTMDACLLETTLTFDEDGDFHYLYSSAGNGDECSTSTGTGSWEHESGNSYSIAAEGLPVGQGTQEISFSNNNNTFSFVRISSLRDSPDKPQLRLTDSRSQRSSASKLHFDLDLFFNLYCSDK